MDKSNPLKVKYYSYKIEFQQRGSAHVHGVLWIDWEELSSTSTTFNVDKVKSAFNAIKSEKRIGEDENEQLIKFADTFVSCSKTSPKVRKIVEDVNIHHHTASCRKYDKPCRFNFPRFPAMKTVLSVPARVAFPDDDERK